MTIAARSRPLVGKYAFWVRDMSDGIRVARFQKATGLGMTLNVGEYSEGGAMAPMKEITTGAFSNVTLEHGVFDNLELFEWVKACMNMLLVSPMGAGVASPNQLRNFAFDQLQRDRTSIRTILAYNCQPVGFRPGEFDNTSTEVQVEELELALEYFTLR